MLIKLGKELKKAREALNASLQAVATPAGISGAYLHKLEQGRVETPSPRVLRQLAIQLGLSYLRLMQLADYLDESHFSEAGEDEGLERQALSAEQTLTPTEQDAVRAFIEVLVAQRKK